MYKCPLKVTFFHHIKINRYIIWLALKYDAKGLEFSIVSLILANK